MYMSDEIPIDETQVNLSPRQRNLLFAIVKEYCDMGDGVGSKELKEKYGFDYSPATIRAELSRLRKFGYLDQPFTNSSSHPTEKAFKLFINQLIVGLQVTSKQQQELKQKIFDLEEQQADMSKGITRLLANQSGGVGFMLNQSQENVTGIKNLLQAPGEGKVSEILDFLDNLDQYRDYFLSHPKQQKLLVNSQLKLRPGRLGRKPADMDNNIDTVLGSENPILPLGKGYGMVSTKVYIDGVESVIGVITPIHLLAKKKNLELVEGLGKLLSGEDEQ
jgi:transcriptional regulator of heat shock response